MQVRELRTAKTGLETRLAQQTALLEKAEKEAGVKEGEAGRARKELALLQHQANHQETGAEQLRGEVARLQAELESLEREADNSRCAYISAPQIIIVAYFKYERPS